MQDGQGKSMMVLQHRRRKSSTRHKNAHLLDSTEAALSSGNEDSDEDEDENEPINQGPHTAHRAHTHALARPSNELIAGAQKNRRGWRRCLSKSTRKPERCEVSPARRLD